MKRLAFITAILILGCQNETEPPEIIDEIIEEQPQAPIPDTTIIVETAKEVVITSDSIAPEELIKNGKTEDFIIECDEEVKANAIMDLDYMRENWKNAPNPLIATYKGNEFGDYFHIMFEDKEGNGYDFGSGNNHFNEYNLYDNSDQLEDNQQYLNQTFKIYWA